MMKCEITVPNYSAELSFSDLKSSYTAYPDFQLRLGIAKLDENQNQFNNPDDNIIFITNPNNPDAEFILSIGQLKKFWKW